MPTVLANEDARRELASTVKRLRVAVTSDPARTQELADALVRLTATRLQAWAFTEAAADAPDSVVLAARILAQGGAAGPYAELADAVRFFSASAQLAAVQAQLGLADAAGRTLAGLDAWRGQVGRLPLLENLAAETAVWALLARSRSLLGDPTSANAYADAAAARRYLSTLPLTQVVAVHLLVADARWSAGRPDEALAQHRLSLAAHESLVAEVPARPRPAVLATVTATAAASHEPYALRLEAMGQLDFALGIRRAHLAQLERFGADTADARVWLAAGLRRAGREEEGGESGAASQAREAPLAPPAEVADWARLGAAESLVPEASRQDLANGYARFEADTWTAGHDAAQARVGAEAVEQRHRDRAAGLARERAEAQAAAAARAAADAESETAARLAREQADAEAAAAKRAAEQEAARQLVEEHRRKDAEQVRQARLTAAAAADDLAAARAGVRAEHPNPAHRAKALDRLAELLRPLTAVEAYRDELAAALEILVGLRWQLGEADASREAARELKSLTGFH